MRDGESADLHDIASTNRYRQRLWLEPRTVALRADAGRHVALDLFTSAIAAGFFVASIQIGEHTLEVDRVLTCVAVLWCVVDRKLLRHATQNFLLNVFAQIFPRCVEAKMITFGQGFENGPMPLTVVDNLRIGGNRAIANASVRVGDYQLGIKL